MTSTLAESSLPIEQAVSDIDRRSRISQPEFNERYLTAPGRPVIITDATDDWAARQKWTFSFFAERYGDRLVIVADRLGKAKAARKVRFSEYLAYCQIPFATSLAQAKPEYPFYLTTFSPFAEYPELLEDFNEPYFIQGSVYQGLVGPMKNWYYEGFSWVFIGPRGTLSPFHVDLFGTHAWLAQLHGTKEFILLPPPRKDEKFLLGSDLNECEPSGPIKCVLKPGEVIFIPAGWAHQVISLEPSISLTFNFVNHSNYLRHLLAISRDLPQWAKKIDKPDFAATNGHQWASRDFGADNSGGSIVASSNRTD